MSKPCTKRILIDLIFFEVSFSCKDMIFAQIYLRKEDEIFDASVFHIEKIVRAFKREKTEYFCECD